jgi:hypothetical protein
MQLAFQYGFLEAWPQFKIGWEWDCAVKSGMYDHIKFMMLVECANYVNWNITGELNLASTCCWLKASLLCTCNIICRPINCSGTFMRWKKYESFSKIIILAHGSMTLFIAWFLHIAWVLPGGQSTFPLGKIIENDHQNLVQRKKSLKLTV